MPATSDAMVRTAKKHPTAIPTIAVMFVLCVGMTAGVSIMVLCVVVSTTADEVNVVSSKVVKFDSV